MSLNNRNINVTKLNLSAEALWSNAYDYSVLDIADYAETKIKKITDNKFAILAPYNFFVIDSLGKPSFTKNIYVNISDFITFNNKDYFIAGYGPVGFPKTVTDNILFQIGLIKTDDNCVDQISGISGMEEDKLKVFPNPSQGVIKIQSSAEQKIIKVEVFNVCGMKIQETNNIFNDIAEINLSTYKPGIYLLKVSMADYCVYKKINLQ